MKPCRYCGQLQVHNLVCRYVEGMAPHGNVAVLADQRGDPPTKCYHFNDAATCMVCGKGPGQTVIADRAKIRGDFREQAKIAQYLKAEFRVSPNWGKLSPAQWECLDEMANKIARILTGDPNEADAWLDLIGYPTLVHNILTKGTPT